MHVTEAEYAAIVARTKAPAKRAAIPAPTEAQEQEAVMTWARCTVGRLPSLCWLFHVPNGGARDGATAAAMQRQGVQRGVPDLCLPVPVGDYHGLWIELKRRDHSNHASPEQVRWLEHLRASRYMAVVCYGADEAIATLEAYLDAR
jgi:hypothetical protein